MPPGSRSVPVAYGLYKRAMAARAADFVAAESTFEKWSQQWSWRERSQTWDNELATQTAVAAMQAAREEGEKWARRRQEIIEREWLTSQKLSERVDLMLSVPLMEETKPVDIQNPDGTITRSITIKPAGWKLRDAERLAERASILQRRAAAMASDLSAVEITGLPDQVTTNVNTNVAVGVGVSSNANAAPGQSGQMAGRSNLPMEIVIGLARQFIAIQTARFPDRPRQSILEAAARESGVPLALLTESVENGNSD